MIRIAALSLVEGHRSRLEGILAPGLRVEVRRDDADPQRWILLATCQLVAVPPKQGSGSSRLSVHPPTEAERARQAARDAIERHGGGELNDPLPWDPA